jgi:hypothetical protein
MGQTQQQQKNISDWWKIEVCRGGGLRSAAANGSTKQRTFIMGACSNSSALYSPFK